jgi:hypothetical protein
MNGDLSTSPGRTDAKHRSGPCKNLKLSLVCCLAMGVFIRLGMAYTVLWFPNPATENVTSYKAYEATGSPRTYTLLATTGPSPSPTGSPIKYSFPLPLPTPATTPRFVVITAVNASGEGLKSAEIAITPTPTPTPPFPTAPTGLQVIP